MIRKLPLILLLALLMLACCMNAHAAFSLKKIVLPARFNGVVITNAIYDQAGFIWFLTNGGLHRYDGNQVISFNYQTNPAIDYAAIHCMMADEDGHLWLGGDNGLIRFNLVSWTTIRLKFRAKVLRRKVKAVIISSIFQTRGGVVLAGTTDGRLYKVKKDTLVKIFDAGLSLSHPASSNFEIENIVQDHENSIWLSLTKGYLIHLHLSKKKRVEKYKVRHFNNDEIFSMIYAPRYDRILFSLNAGVYAMDSRTYDIDTVFKKQPTVRVFFHRLNNNIYSLRAVLGDNGTIAIYDYPGNNLKEELTLPSGWFKTLAQRKNKVMLSDGVTLYELIQSKESIKKYFYDIKHNNSIRSIFKIGPHQLLISCYYKARLLLFNTVTGSVKKISSMVPYTFLSWSRDTVLIGEEGHGMFWYLKKKQKLVPLSLTAATSYKSPKFNPYIICVQRETDTTVWVGTLQGLRLINPHKGIYKDPLQGEWAPVLNSLRISAILPVRDKRVLATSKGLFYFNLSDHQVRVFSNGLKERMFYCLQRIGDKIWAGSKGMGLIVMNDSGKVLKRIDHSLGLAGNTVFSLKRWRDYLIAGTGRGLSIIHPPDMKIKNFTINDGLPSNECNYSALWVTADQTYVGTTKGMAVFNVAQLFKNKGDDISPLNISVLKETDRDGGRLEDYTFPYKQPSQMVIPAGTAVFSITISNENYLSHLQKIYYRLSKEDRWKEITNKSTLSFVNMPPGKYRLELAGKTISGSMVEGLYKNLLVVTPFYYQTLWFKILMVLLALGVIFLIARFIVKYREKNIEKERLLRLQIAGDLHDEVGSTLAGISMQADMLLNGRQEHLKEYLQRIADSGRSAVHIMGDIVWSIDPRNDGSINLLQRMKRYGKRMLEPAGIRIAFHVQGRNEQIYMPQKTRQNIMLIFKEALTNISKHSEATQVDVSFISRKKEMKLIIADNGKGLSVTDTCSPAEAGGHGLRNMQMRADAIEATFDLPPVEKGVTIIVTLKL